MIRPLTKEYIDSVVNIHIETMPDDFFPLLGRRFLKYFFYSATLNSKYGSTLVSLSNTNNVQGFITIALNNGLFLRDILQRRFLYFMVFGLPPIFLSFRLLKYSWEIFNNLLKKERVSILAEIVFIAVGSKYQNQGLGKLLVKETLLYLNNHGYDCCKTKVNKENVSARRMYEKMGYPVIDQYKLTGKEWMIYHIS